MVPICSHSKYVAKKVKNWDVLPIAMIRGFFFLGPAQSNSTRGQCQDHLILNCRKFSALKLHHVASTDIHSTNKLVVCWPKIWNGLRCNTLFITLFLRFRPSSCHCSKMFQVSLCVGLICSWLCLLLGCSTFLCFLGASGGSGIRQRGEIMDAQSLLAAQYQHTSCVSPQPYYEGANQPKETVPRLKYPSTKIEAHQNISSLSKS